MKVTIKDPWVGEREISMDDSFELSLIKDQYELLLAFRDDGRVPSQELLEDIQVYDYIINNEDPNAAASSYFIKKQELSMDRKTIRIKKRKAAYDIFKDLKNGGATAVQWGESL